VRALHLGDLALACACADGHEPAWEHFVLEHRPSLYRAAEAMRPGGGRELADSLYAELFGVSQRGEAKTSLFRYFHGRSSLSTWLRAILAQRHVDAIRVERRHEPLPEEDGAAGLSRLLASPASAAASASEERDRWVSVVQRTLSEAVAALEAKDRLRLGCYYVESMTLAEIGRALGEHEATVSRHLSRIRRALRTEVERQLRERHGMTHAEMAECFASVSADAGSLDLGALINAPPAEAGISGAAGSRGPGDSTSAVGRASKIDAV
jgi:RNA polymerase sigma factor (sigma-70 family)